MRDSSTSEPRQTPISIRIGLEVYGRNACPQTTERAELAPKYNIRLTKLYKTLMKVVVP
jgi:hypothetical protein